MQDHLLLTDFAETRSQDAFAELVRRYMDPVYSAARRQVRDSQLAEDVAQAVFIILARKAQNLKDRESLAGWIMKTTHLACRDALKAESRRRRHEGRAALLNQSSVEQTMSSPNEEIAPELDRAMSRLAESDRCAVTLRYLQGKTTSETADCLGISEPAAAKRIFRAVDRLRKILLRNRAVAPTIALAVVLDQIPRIPAPAALAANAIAAATTGSAAPAALAIAKGVLHMMTFHKILTAMLLVAAVAGLTGVGVGTVKLLADQTAPPPGAPPPAAPASARFPVYKASLSNGVSLEILGLGEYPPTGKPWWLANGDRRDIPPYEHAPMGGSKKPSVGYVAREIAVKVNGAVNGSADNADVIWYVAKTQGASASPIEDNPQFGRQIANTQEEVNTLADTPAGMTIHANVAAGKWRTICTAGPHGGEGHEIDHDWFLFGDVFTVDRETHIVVGYVERPQQEIAITATDLAGNVVRANLRSTISGIGNGSMCMETFGVNLPQTSIHQWQLQTRLFDQWIEIRGISLHPGQKTNVKTVTSDDQQNP